MDGLVEPECEQVSQRAVENVLGYVEGRVHHRKERFVEVAGFYYDCQNFSASQGAEGREVLVTFLVLWHDGWWWSDRSWEQSVAADQYKNMR